ncbi:MAG: hypothetical protein H0V73_01060, partial [Chloroflexi bacterium]|nr:hypothetical protein [Chloroflexota bacterium]
PTPTPTPTPAPGDAKILVIKVLDIDGDLSTESDQTVVPDWTFDVGVTGGTPSATSITTADQGADVPFADVSVSVDDGSAHVTLTENQQEGFEIIDAFCFDDSDFGTLTDLSLDFDVAAGSNATCVFFNTGGAVQEATGTPSVTPPPTDTMTPARSSGDGTRLLLLVVAGVIATLLIVTPAPASRRRR